MKLELIIEELEKHNIATLNIDNVIYQVLKQCDGFVLQIETIVGIFFEKIDENTNLELLLVRNGLL